MADEQIKEQDEESKAKNKKNALIGCGILIAIVIILAAVMGTCLGGESTDTNTPSSTPRSIPVSYPTVVYEITGSAKYVNVTLNNSTGGTEQYSDILIPKRYTYDSFSDSFLYISAQNQGEYGTVTVSIYVNDTLFKTSASSGAYVIATASGMR